MNTPEAGVSTHSSPKSNKGAILRRGFGRQANLAPQAPREVAAAASWQKYPNLLRTLIGTSLPFPVRGRGPRRPARPAGSPLDCRKILSSCKIFGTFALQFP